MDVHAEALYRRWHRHMVVYAAGALKGDHEVAEDVVQQVWMGYIGAVRGGATFRNVEGFLLRILSRRIVDEIRRRNRDRRVLSLGSPICANIRTTGVTVADEAASLADMRVIRDAIDALPEHYRLAVKARVSLGMSIAQHAAYAEKAGVVRTGSDPYKAAENHYYRALAVLRERLRSELPLLGA